MLCFFRIIYVFVFNEIDASNDQRVGSNIRWINFNDGTLSAGGRPAGKRAQQQDEDGSVAWEPLEQHTAPVFGYLKKYLYQCPLFVSMLLQYNPINVNGM